MNSLNQRTNVAQTGAAFAAPRDIAWGYDVLGQVTSANSTENTHDRAYQYDAIGNRKKTADSLNLPGADNYTSNALNQYALTPTAASLTHDADGNMTSGTIPADVTANSTLVWDAENRLVKITKPNGDVIDFEYDYMSRRISKKVTGNEAKITVYDGWNPIAEYNVGTSVPLVLSKSFTWGTDLSGTLQGAGGVGGLLAVTDSTISYYPTYDGNGNVSEYLNSIGTSVAHYEYDPFGKTTVATGTKNNDFTHRFSTKPLDAETGLYNYGLRFYNPNTGRWPSSDPIEEEGGLNLYGFVENDGVNEVDMLGLWFADGSARVDKVHGIVLDGQGALMFDPEGGHDELDEIHEKAHIAQISGGADPRDPNDQNPKITVGPVAEWVAIPYKQLFWCCSEDKKGNPIRDDEGEIKYKGWCYFKNHGTWQKPDMKRHYFKNNEKELWGIGTQVTPFNTHQAADSEIPMYQWNLKHLKNKNKIKKTKFLLAQHQQNKMEKFVEYQSWTAFKKAHADEKARYQKLGLTWKWKDNTKVYADIK